MNTNKALNSNKFLTADEDQRLLNRLKSEHSRDSLMLLLLRTCGMRSSELRSLRFRDLNRSTKTIFITASKGSDNRELPPPEYVWERLVQYVEATPSDITGLIFPICRSRLTEIWRGYRPIGCGKGLHSLRHTFAIEAYQNTKDILLVKQFLGHRSIVSTMVYEAFLYSNEEFKRYMDNHMKVKFEEVFLSPGERAQRKLLGVGAKA